MVNIKTNPIFVMLIAVLTINCAPDPQKNKLSIHNGFEENGNHPYVANLTLDGQNFCSGTLVHPRLIVTAAHCMTAINLFKDKLQFIEAQFTYTDDTGTVKRAFYHIDSYNGFPEFKGTKYGTRDVGYIKLTEEVTEFAPAILMTDTTEIEKATSLGNKTKIIGFGFTEDNDRGTKISKLQKVIKKDDSYQNPMEVEVALDSLAGDKGGACRGDSGGPAMAEFDNEYKVFGVSSRGASSCEGFSIYGLLFHSICWISRDSDIEIDPDLDCSGTSEVEEAPPTMFTESDWDSECAHPATPEIDKDFQLLKSIFDRENCEDLKERLFGEEQPAPKLNFVRIQNLWITTALRGDYQNRLYHANSGVTNMAWLATIPELSYGLYLHLPFNAINKFNFPPYKANFHLIDLAHNNLTSFPDYIDGWVGHLDLSWNNINSVPLLDAENISTLKLTGNPIDDVSLVADYKHLYKLDVSHTQVTDISKVHSSKLSTIKFADTDISDAQILANAKNLYDVDGRNSLVSDLEWTKGLAALHEMDFSGARIVGEVDLSTNHDLAKIYLSRNQITKIAVGLNKFHWLGRLEAEDNLVSEVSNIAKGTFSYFFLANNNLTNLDFIPEGDSIVYLDVSGNELLINIDRLKSLIVIGAVHLPYQEGHIDENHPVVKDLRSRNIEVVFSRETSSSDIRDEMLGNWPELSNRKLTKPEIYHLFGYVRSLPDDAYIRKNLVEDSMVIDSLFEELFEAKGSDSFLLKPLSSFKSNFSFLSHVSK